MSNNTIFEIFEGPDDQLWFAGRNGGLSYYNGKTIQEYEFNEDLRRITKGRWLTNFIYEEGQLLFVTSLALSNYHHFGY